MFLNCVAGEDSWESLGQQGDQILKEINPEYSLEGLMLKFQYLGHLIGRADSLEKPLMLGKTKGKKRRGQERMRWLGGITDSKDMSLNEGQGNLAYCSPRSHRARYDLATDQQHDQKRSEIVLTSHPNWLFWLFCTYKKWRLNRFVNGHIFKAHPETNTKICDLGWAMYWFKVDKEINNSISDQ